MAQFHVFGQSYSIVKYCHHSRNVSCATFPINSPPCPVNQCSDFYYRRSAVPIQEFHMNGTHTVCILLCLASLPQYNVFEIQTGGYEFQQFVLFYIWVVSHCMNKPQFVHPISLSIVSLILMSPLHFCFWVSYVWHVNWALVIGWFLWLPSWSSLHSHAPLARA